jgi:hypothetical protein
MDLAPNLGSDFFDGEFIFYIRTGN